ncbi:MAG: hypothetical protein K6E53_03400 [Lachnospiraceae bacterium]|nr:hypothetical protein [Lachnospiraceae bacterium]
MLKIVNEDEETYGNNDEIMFDEESLRDYYIVKDPLAKLLAQKDWKGAEMMIAKKKDELKFDEEFEEYLAKGSAPIRLGTDVYRCYFEHLAESIAAGYEDAESVEFRYLYSLRTRLTCMDTIRLIMMLDELVEPDQVKDLFAELFVRLAWEMTCSENMKIPYQKRIEAILKKHFRAAVERDEEVLMEETVWRRMIGLTKRPIGFGDIQPQQGEAVRRLWHRVTGLEFLFPWDRFYSITGFRDNNPFCNISSIPELRLIVWVSDRVVHSSVPDECDGAIFREPDDFILTAIKKNVIAKNQIDRAIEHAREEEKYSVIPALLLKRYDMWDDIL